MIYLPSLSLENVIGDALLSFGGLCVHGQLWEKPDLAGVHLAAKCTLEANDCPHHLTEEMLAS